MKRKKRCPYCGKLFCPHPRPGNRQISCGNKFCKRQQKRLADKHYKQNHQETYLANRQDWLDKNTIYWKQYRDEHPEYTARNREQTRIRKSLLTASPKGLQKRIDILQTLESYMDIWNFAQFAKANRSIAPLLYAYNRSRTDIQGGFT